ncbi:MAG TPA: type II toxin-antitoxin system VapC family toxin [Rhizomicrobium sp.]|nr:type II toxin-antitoxin system VapC family toxin [Rhizomicrobium sp.]
MFVDASAIIAILANEKEGPALLAKLDGATASFTSPVAIYEASLGLARSQRISIEDAERVVTTLTKDKRTDVVAISAKTSAIALNAFSRFGKGRNPAGLNMGDCFAYACAKELGVPLLYKGDDFAMTDIEVA